jgi:DNA-binding response OmpR family regulator
MPAKNPVRVLLIEDDAADTRNAVAIFNKLGLKVQSKITVLAARHFLEDVAEGEHAAPHLIVLDLGFPNESGFEVLRYWKSTPALQAIPVIVWTQAGDQDRKIAGYFSVAAVVMKSDGLKELENAVKSVVAGLG